MANKTAKYLDTMLDCLMDAGLDVRIVRRSDYWTSGQAVDLKDKKMGLHYVQ